MRSTDDASNETLCRQLIIIIVAVTKAMGAVSLSGFVRGFESNATTLSGLAQLAADKPCSSFTVAIAM